MPIIEFSEKDLLRGKEVPPDWYRVHIDSVGEAPSKDGGSTNYPVEGTIQFNATNGDKQFNGVPLSWNFNSKAISFARGFIESLGTSPEASKRYELANAAGKEIDVFVDNDIYQGRVVNRVNHKYRAPRVAEQV